MESARLITDEPQHEEEKDVEVRSERQSRNEFGVRRVEEEEIRAEQQPQRVEEVSHVDSIVVEQGETPAVSVEGTGDMSIVRIVTHIPEQLSCPGFRCPKCPARFVQSTRLSSHLLSEHQTLSARFFKCTHCRKFHVHEQAARACSESHLNEALGPAAQEAGQQPKVTKTDDKFWPPQLRLEKKSRFFKRRAKKDVRCAGRVQSQTTPRTGRTLPKDFDSRVEQEVEGAQDTFEGMSLKLLPCTCGCRTYASR